MTKRYIFGWMEQTLLLRRSDQGSGKGNEAEMIGCQWLVAQCCSVLHQCHCVSVNTTWQGAIKLDRHQSIFFKTQKQSVCRKATSRYLHAFESFVNKNCDAWLALVDIACFENKLWMEWYCMVLSCIDTIEFILSDWRDTCAGPTENLNKSCCCRACCRSTLLTWRASDNASHISILQAWQSVINR